MNIFVIATTLQVGGGVTIYKQFLSHLPKYIGENKYWIFINSVLPQIEIKGVTYISLPLQPKLKRLLFEGSMLKVEAKKTGVKPDVIISLQNNGYKCFKDCKQIVYYHQALPLYPGCYNPLKRSERVLFNYKYVFPRIVKHSWAKDTTFIVQTPVVKQRFVSYFDIPQENIYVCPPDIDKIDTELYHGFEWKDGKYHFIYVGDDFKYRNFQVLVNAVKYLIKKHPNISEKIRIHVTCPTVNVEGTGNVFVFEGVIDREFLLNFYKSSVALLAPSTIETVGLPMLEAAIFGMPIISSDIDFSRFVLRGYDGVQFVLFDDVKAWALKIEDAYKQLKRYKPIVLEQNSSWENVYQLIKKYE